jgi:hypothetical protein
MKTYQDQTRLETLHQQAQKHALLETTRNQDQTSLRQSLSVILEIAKHWTVGIEAPQVSRQLLGKH